MEFQYAENSKIVAFGDLFAGSLFLLPKDSGFLVCLAAEIYNDDDPSTKISVVLGTIDTTHVGAIPAYIDREARRAPFAIRLDGTKISPSSEGSPKWPRPADDAINGALIVDRDLIPWIVVRQESSPLFISTNSGEATYRSPQSAVIFHQWSITIPDGEGHQVVAAKPTYNLDNL